MSYETDKKEIIENFMIELKNLLKKYDCELEAIGNNEGESNIDINFNSINGCKDFYSCDKFITQ